MRARQSRPEHGQRALPLLWLISDERNDCFLEECFHRLPAGSGFVFRHYHLSGGERRDRFSDLATKARQIGAHIVVLAGSGSEAAEWSADGVYGAASALGEADGLLKLGTAHNGAELAAAEAAGADGIFLSPVFPTRSHPDVQPLGIHGFSVLTQRSPVPVIALGGMDAERACELAWPRWGAIDGLTSAHTP